MSDELLITTETEMLVSNDTALESIVLTERELLVETVQEIIEVPSPPELLIERVEALEVIDTTTPIEILEVGMQGPPGPPGASSATDYIVTAAVPLSGHIAVVLDVSGHAIPADPLNAAHGNAIVGLTKGAASTGAQTPVAVLGSLEHLGWTFTPDQPVYLGASGTPVQTSPLGAAFLKVLGMAQSATRITVSLQPAIYLT